MASSLNRKNTLEVQKGKDVKGEKPVREPQDAKRVDGKPQPKAQILDACENEH